MGVKIGPDIITPNTKPLYGTSFSFTGGGTQTVLSLNAGEIWFFYSAVVNYGGSDYRHGSMYYAARATNGGQIRGYYLGTQQSNSIFSTSGSYQVQYSAGGGNPFTTVYMTRLR